MFFRSPDQRKAVFAKLNKGDYKKMTDFMDLSFDEKLNYDTYDNRRYMATQMMNVIGGRMENLDKITLMNLIMDYSAKHGSSNVKHVDWVEVDRDYAHLGLESTKRNLLMGAYDLPSKGMPESEFSKAANVSRGKRFEQKIHARLGRSDSIVTMRSTGSRGMWDMVAITPDKVRLVQAKTHGYLTPADREEMLEQLQQMPDNVQAELEYYESPRVSRNFTLKKAGETDWNKVEERLEHFGKVRGFRKVKSDKVVDEVSDEI